MCAGSIGRETVTIANGASLSDALELQEGASLLSLQTDSAWDTNAISFAVSSELFATPAAVLAGTFVPLFIRDTDGTFNEATIDAAAASRAYQLPAEWFKGFRWVKVRSGLVGAAANQSGATVITLTHGG